MSNTIRIRLMPGEDLRESLEQVNAAGEGNETMNETLRKLLIRGAEAMAAPAPRQEDAAPMTNIEKLAKHIHEEDPDGKLLPVFLAVLEAALS